MWNYEACPGSCLRVDVCKMCKVGHLFGTGTGVQSACVRALLLWSADRAGNHSRIWCERGFISSGNIFCFKYVKCRAISPKSASGGFLKVKTAAVNPATASVTTSRDSSLKIRLNQITKQTVKRISPDLSLFFPPLHQTDIKSAIYKIPSNDFPFDFSHFVDTYLEWSASCPAWTLAFCPASRLPEIALRNIRQRGYMPSG